MFDTWRLSIGLDRDRLSPASLRIDDRAYGGEVQAKLCRQNVMLQSYTREILSISLSRILDATHHLDNL